MAVWQRWLHHHGSRVVCNNTLSPLRSGGATSAIKGATSTELRAGPVKKRLGITVSQWDSFMYRMKTLTERKGQEP